MATLFEAANSVSCEQLMRMYTTVSFAGLGKNGENPFTLTGQRSGCFGWSLRNGKEVWFDFVNQVGGSKFDFVADINGIDRKDSVGIAKRICSDFNLDYEDESETSVDPKTQLQREIFEALTDVFVKMYFKRGLDFYKRRGLSDYVVNNRKLGYCPKEFSIKGQTYSFLDFIKIRFPNATKEILEEMGIISDKGNCLFADRYVMPYIDSYGRTIGWTGRTLDSNNPCKYVNSKNTDKFFNKEKTLFNWDKAQSCSVIYVVEGTMDALSLIEAGVPGVIATSGVALSNYHLAMLKDKKIILSLDNDIAGKDAIARLIRTHRDTKFYTCILEGYKDFNEFLMHADKSKQLKDYAFDKTHLSMAPQFIMRWFKDNNSLSSPVNREELFDMLCRLIGSYPSNYKPKEYPQNDIYTPIERCIIWKQFLRLFGMNDKKLDDFIKSKTQKKNK